MDLWKKSINPKEQVKNDIQQEKNGYTSLEKKVNKFQEENKNIQRI